MPPPTWDASARIAFAEEMKKLCAADGVNANYMVDETTPTGTCGVLVNGGERSLVAAINAANNYKVEHLEKPENWKLVENARFFYSAGFFLTVSPDSMLKVAKHSAENGKCYMFNLSAPFLMQVPPFKKAMMDVLPYVDVLFGNESEAVTFAESEGWTTKDVAEIAMKISKMPKASGHRGRLVVFTQGLDDTIVAKEGKIYRFPVIPLAKEDLVDTNGAGRRLRRRFPLPVRHREGHPRVRARWQLRRQRHHPAVRLQVPRRAPVPVVLNGEGELRPRLKSRRSSAPSLQGAGGNVRESTRDERPARASRWIIVTVTTAPRCD